VFVAIIVILIIIGSVWFHIWSPWWWTPVASNWGNIDSTIELTFWITGSGSYSAFLSGLYLYLHTQYAINEHTATNTEPVIQNVSSIVLSIFPQFEATGVHHHGLHI
jgi:cytochrome c oxidase subunit 2